jgi:hypothetical protein
VTARREWASHHCVPRGNGPIHLLGLSMMNLDSCAFYRHDGRDPLPTDLVVTPPFKTLTGEAPGTRSFTEPDIEINPTIIIYKLKTRFKQIRVATPSHRSRSCNLVASYSRTENH